MNTYSEVENVLQPVVFATKIRIYPYNQYERTVCLRVEVVGCPTDGELRNGSGNDDLLTDQENNANG